jgi:hypothetical protein
MTATKTPTSEDAITFRRDRIHQFEVGDKVAHVDAPEIPMLVTEATWRVRDGVAYPTYTLASLETPADSATDVLCTRDLVAYEPPPPPDELPLFPHQRVPEIPTPQNEDDYLRFGSRIDDRFWYAIWRGGHQVVVHAYLEGEKPGESSPEFTVTIFVPRESYGTRESSEISWPSISNKTIRYAEAMAEALEIAASIARRLDEQEGA